MSKRYKAEGVLFLILNKPSAFFIEVMPGKLMSPEHRREQYDQGKYFKAP